jgi:acid phosphatase (class A)
LAANRIGRKFTIFNFTIAAGPWFVEANLPKTTAFFEKVQKDAEIVTKLGKDYFKRPRPYTTDPSLINSKLEKSFSYPSGHSTESMTLALVLADLLPDRYDAILAHARQMGWHRVQIARHYATNILCRARPGTDCRQTVQESDDFKKEFGEAKAEIATTLKNQSHLIVTLPAYK